MCALRLTCAGQEPGEADDDERGTAEDREVEHLMKESTAGCRSSSRFSPRWPVDCSVSTRHAHV